ncbi:MAG TPA: amidohydrolase family protein, partial [Thermoanaerobaculia bacterium]|nr:amidohydrolase family protein [Thermoanaerobaculia bacterium]
AGAAAAAAQPGPPPSEEDLAAARAVFAANLAAIAAKDRDAYLATYLHAPTLARTGFEGPLVGFEDFAAQAGEWPDVFEGRDLELVPVADGVIYGTYRYRVAYAGDEHRGISERVFVETPGGWRIAVTSAFDAPPGTPPPPLALVGGTLLDGTGAPPVADAVVVLRGGLVDCAGTRAACPVPEGIETVDVAGRWITPGLVDAHVHFSQTGWADGRPDALDARDRFPYAETIAENAARPERFFRSYLCSGVTAVFDVGGYPWTLDLSERAERDTLAPRVAAAGPLLSTWDFWLNLPGERQFVYLADEAAGRDGVAWLAARGADAVKVWLIVTGERPLDEMERAVAAAGAEAERRGLPLVVHATGLAEAKAALGAGADVLVHGVDDQPVDEEFLDLARAAGTVYTPTLTVPGGYLALYRSAAGGEPPAVDDPNGCVDPETRAKVAATPELDPPPGLDLDRVAARLAAQRRVADENLLRVHRAGIPVALGTDAGNPLTLHGPAVYAELEAMQAAGLSPMEVLVAATRNAARAMGRPDLGTLAPGQAADLLVLAADPTAGAAAFRSVTHVARGGVLRPVAELGPLAAGGSP